MGWGEGPFSSVTVVIAIVWLICIVLSGRQGVK
jgi:hypothetical protein